MCTVLLPPSVNPVAVNKYIDIDINIKSDYSDSYKFQHSCKKNVNCVWTVWNIWTVWTVWTVSTIFVLASHCHGRTCTSKCLSHACLLLQAFDTRRSGKLRRATEEQWLHISAHPITKMAGGVPTAEGLTRRTNDKRKAMAVSKTMEAVKENLL